MHIRQFLRDTAGTTAVEFAILMPMMLVCFAGIVEGARIFWNYQGAVSGVRDASRYLARVTDQDICAGVSNPLPRALPAGAGTTALQIIQRNIGTGDSNLFPSAVRVQAVTASYTCVDHNLRTDPTPVARVQARLEVQLPFGTVFAFFGRRNTSTMTSDIIDQSRIYGL